MIHIDKLVTIKNNNVFTDSLIIAKGTKIEHRATQQLIKNYEKDISDFGRVTFEMIPLETKGGIQNVKVYFLNEQQATFLISLMKNTKVVVKFKKNLVKQFYAMRQLLQEKQTTHWIETRQQSKSNRKLETDEIKKFIEYAFANGSHNADWYYKSLTNLANGVVGIGSNQRDSISVSQLNNLLLIENIIGHVIVEGIEKQLYYKEIYKDCKKRLEMFKDLAYLELSA